VALGVFAVLAMFLAFTLWAVLFVRPQNGFGYVQEFPSARYQPRPLLRNPSERAAWKFLARTDLGQAHVFAKVRVEDFLAARGPRWRAAVARAGMRGGRVDFLLTDAAFRPLVAVDIDARSRPAGLRAATAWRDRLLRSAGVPLLHLPAAADWNQVLMQWRQDRTT